MSVGGRRLVPRAAVAHDVGADGAVRHVRRDVDRARQLLERVEVLGEALPLPRDAFGERGAGDVLDAFHEADQPLVAIGGGGREADAAVAHDDGRDAVPRRRRHLGVPRRLAVVVGVDVDEAGRDDLAAWRRSPRGRAAAIGPTAAIRSPSIATSAATGSPPVPSTTVPPRITRSCIAITPPTFALDPVAVAQTGRCATQFSSTPTGSNALGAPRLGLLAEDPLGHPDRLRRAGDLGGGLACSHRGPATGSRIVREGRQVFSGSRTTCSPSRRSVSTCRGSWVRGPRGRWTPTSSRSATSWSSCAATWAAAPSCAKRMPPDGRKPGHWASSVMLLECAKLKHWRCEHDFAPSLLRRVRLQRLMWLLLESSGSIGELEEHWNHFDTL